MGEFTKYKVVLNGTILPNEDREQTIRDLCDLFHSRPSYIEKLLMGKEVSLKKEYPKSEAENICKAIRAAGAQAKLVPVREQELEVLDDDFSTLSGLSMNEFGGAMICPSCQQECDSAWESCEYCGYNFVRRETEGGFSFGTVDDGLPVEKQDIDDRVPMPHKTDIIRFVGPNADHYLDKFEEMGSFRHPSFKFSWCWPAFFAFMLWALYRKMWIPAAVNLVTSFILMYFMSSSPMWSVIAIGYALFWPVTANYLYYRHVGHHIKQITPETSDEEKKFFLETKGGVSKPALFGGLILSFAFSLIVGNMITAQLLEKYNERYAQLIQGADQLRGSGDPVGQIKNKNTPLYRTSAAFTLIAERLKTVIATEDKQATNAVFDRLLVSSENEEIKDAWNTPIQITREADRIVLLSAGPDRKLKTDDDLLQVIFY